MEGRTFSRVEAIVVPALAPRRSGNDLYSNLPQGPVNNSESLAFEMLWPKLSGRFSSENLLLTLTREDDGDSRSKIRQIDPKVESELTLSNTGPFYTATRSLSYLNCAYRRRHTMPKIAQVAET